MPTLNDDVPLIPRALLFDNPERLLPKVSPDGTKLAYLRPDNGVMNVFVGDIGAADESSFVPVTSDKVRGIASFLWQQDSKHILYAQDEGGDENWRLYQTAVATRETRNLTPFEKVQARILSVDRRFPDTALIALNHRDARVHDVYRLDLPTGDLALLVENTEGFAGFVADNQQRVRAAQKMRADGGTEIYVRETEDSPWRSLLTWDADDTGSVIAFTPDDSGLWILTSKDANAVRLVEFGIASETTTVLAEDPAYDVSDLLVHPVTRTLQAVAFDRARTEWLVLDDTLRTDFDRLLREREGVVYVLSRDDSDGLWTAGYVTDDGPIHFYLYRRESQSAERLFSDRPGLEAYPLAKVEPISYPARDGMLLHGYLTLPPGGERTNLPLILLVHGGPWARDSWRFQPQAQLLANRGYAVLQINYRGSRGYGKAYLNAGDREWAGKMHDDLIDGKRWAITQEIADPARVAIAGGSYGGYAALVGLTFTPEEFACGVDLVGPSNLNTLLASIPPYWEPIKALFTKRMGDDEEFLKERSPLFKVDAIVRPLLIAQGANDPRVKITESDQMVAAMRASGKPVEYIVFPDEGHGFRRPENNLYFNAKMEEFLAKYLGERAEPFAEVPGSSGEVR